MRIGSRVTSGKEMLDGTSPASLHPPHAAGNTRLLCPMIEVHSITLREIHLPLVRPFRTAGGEVRGRRIVLLELAADGVSVWSECVAQSLPSYSPDTVDSCWLAISEWLAPRVVGGHFSSASDAYAALSAGVRGNRMAIAAVEMGIWVLSAEMQSLPLAELLARESSAASGGDSEGEGTGAPRVADGIVRPRKVVEAGTAIGISEDPDEAVRRVSEAVESGFRRIRLKIAPGQDSGPIRATRDAAGGQMPIIADANGSYSSDDAAHLAAIQGFDALGLSMLEQPFAPQGFPAHAELGRLIATPVCLDESVTCLGDAREALALGSMSALNLKAGRVGGLLQAVAIHDECARHRVPLWCGGMLESGIGRACNVALASLPGFVLPGDVGPSDGYWARDVVTRPWTMDASGQVTVPLDRPGIGVEVDADFVDSLTVRKLTIQAN